MDINNKLGVTQEKEEEKAQAPGVFKGDRWQDDYDEKEERNKK